MNLFRALVTVSGMTLISRVLGFVRDAAIARVFGAGLYADAFFVAFKIPNLLRRLFAEGALTQAFVPVLAEYRNRRGLDATRALVDRVSGVLAVALAAVTVAGIVGAPVIIYVSAPGFVADPDKFRVSVELLRITFPYIFFISLTALAGGILNTLGRFSVPAFTPVLLNLSFIVFTLVLAPWFDPPVKALAWAVFVGGCLQLAFQLPFLWRAGMLPRPKPDPADPGVRRVLTLMAPAALGVSVSQVSLVINNIFASFLVTGSVSWLYYADRLMEFPSGLLGVALGTILLPTLARFFNDEAGGGARYSALLDWGLRLAFLLAVPAAAALAVLALPLVSTLFQYGAFSAHDVSMTCQAVVAYSVGLTGIILVKVLAPGFYARQDIRTPVRIALWTLLVTQCLNVLLVGPLGHAGLALSIGTAACFNAALLYRGLRAGGIYQPAPGWSLFLVRLAVAVCAMAAVLWFAAGPAAWWTAASGSFRVARLGGVILLGAATYLLVLMALGFRPRQFVHRDRTDDGPVAPNRE